MPTASCWYVDTDVLWYSTVQTYTKQLYLCDMWLPRPVPESQDPFTTQRKDLNIYVIGMKPRRAFALSAYDTCRPRKKEA